MPSSPIFLATTVCKQIVAVYIGFTSPNKTEEENWADSQLTILHLAQDFDGIVDLQSKLISLLGHIVIQRLTLRAICSAAKQKMINSRREQ